MNWKLTEIIAPVDWNDDEEIRMMDEWDDEESNPDCEEIPRLVEWEDGETV